MTCLDSYSPVYSLTAHNRTCIALPYLIIVRGVPWWQRITCRWAVAFLHITNNIIFHSRGTPALDNSLDSSSSIVVDGFRQISSYVHAPVHFNHLDMQVHLALAQFLHLQDPMSMNSWDRGSSTINRGWNLPLVGSLYHPSSMGETLSGEGSFGKYRTWLW